MTYQNAPDIQKSTRMLFGATKMTNKDRRGARETPLAPIKSDNGILLEYAKLGSRSIEVHVSFTRNILVTRYYSFHE